MRSGLFVPLFDELADPAVVARLCAEAEEAGWHGVFVWDNLRFREPVADVADPWITLAAMATATERIRLGPMVTPLARRRPVKVARETATLDLLSGGRLTLGVGLGSDRFASEYSITGEELDDRRRASMLDESLEILAAAWSGEPVHHRGEHYTVDGMRFLPRPVQRPAVPVWVAGYYGKPRPVRRAARHQGFFPLELDHPDQLAEIVADLTALRKEAGGTPRSATTWSSPSRPAAIRRLTSRQAQLVARRAPMGCAVGRPGAHRNPRRPGGAGVACPEGCGAGAIRQR
jgi:alkanesulfonate monooxygenase SsuD/methylene tetrahydromethanopterin reductase-like flavin-dependent oxidoreductase (luciferase family)